MSGPLADAQASVEGLLLELKSFVIVAEQLTPDEAPKRELDLVAWPWLAGRMVRRLEDATLSYFDLVGMLQRGVKDRPSRPS